MIRRLLRRVLRNGRDLLIGPPEFSIMDQIVRRESRWGTFLSAIEYANYEGVPGDIMEFGVFAGMSLALLAKAQSFDGRGLRRRVVGFDAFKGLPEAAEAHARWRVGDCAKIHSWHPWLPVGAPVTPEVTRELFQVCGLPQPELEIGWYQHSLPKVIPSKYREAAVLHIDCDLYESTREVLEGVAPALQDGSIILFDDWFHYKANPQRGEARAFAEFLEKHPGWGAVPYRTYGTFCNSFILYRR